MPNDEQTDIGPESSERDTYTQREQENPDVTSWLDLDQEARAFIIKRMLIVYGTAFAILLWIAILRKQRRHG